MKNTRKPEETNIYLSKVTRKARRAAQRASELENCPAQHLLARHPAHLAGWPPSKAASPTEPLSPQELRDVESVRSGALHPDALIYPGCHRSRTRAAIDVVRAAMRLVWLDSARIIMDTGHERAAPEETRRYYDLMIWLEDHEGTRGAPT